MASGAAREGTAPFTVGAETYQTYYKLFGSLTNREHTPLVCLHAGPGLTHNYLAAIGDLTSSAGIPVILYDQLGSGRSTHVHNKPPTFWTMDLMIDQLVSLLTYLDVQNAFDILGHSWGGALACEFEVRRRPAGLKHLILSDSLASLALWNQSVLQLLRNFPTEVQEGMMSGMGDPERYYKSLLQLYAVHGCTVKPVPKEYADGLDAIFGENGDATVTIALMQGDFNGWTIIDRLHLIRMPTLVIRGKQDIAQDYVVAPFNQKIPNVREVIFENSSHVPMIEERAKYIEVVGNFLRV